MSQIDKSEGYALVEPPEDYEGYLKTINWKGFYVPVGLGYSPFFFKELEEIRKNIEACIIVITGKAGRGKTYFGLRLAEIMDSKFDVNVQVPFGSDEFLNLISEDSPLKMGQVIIPDETQFTMGSRSWYKDIQQDLMNQLEAVRSKGYIIILVALSMKVLDIIARNYVITHLIHMKKRGEGTAYKFYMPAFVSEPYPKKMGIVKLNLPGYESCRHSTCLKCKYSGLRKRDWAKREKWTENNFPLCMSIRAIYERKKKAFLEAEAKKSNERKAAKEARAKGVDYEAYADAIALEYHTLPSTKKNDRKDTEAIAHLLSKKLNKPVSTYAANKVRRITEMRLADASSTGT